jgi:hypothetical protein
MRNNCRPTLRILALAAVTGMILGCAGKQPRKEDTSDAATLAKDSPCSSSSVCRTIAFGAKACGGPQRYLIYSASATDSARLYREVARYNEAERKRNREEGRMSDCMAVVRPQVSCISGQCRAATPGIQ